MFSWDIEPALFVVSIQAGGLLESTPVFGPRTFTAVVNGTMPIFTNRLPAVGKEY